MEMDEKARKSSTRLLRYEKSRARINNSPTLLFYDENRKYTRLCLLMMKSLLLGLRRCRCKKIERRLLKDVRIGKNC